MVEMEELSPTPCENGGENRACARASRRSPDSPRGRDEDGRYELLAEFRDYLVTLKRSRATIAATLNPLKPFFAFIDRGSLDLRAVRMSDIEAYKAELVTGGRYTANSIDTYMRAVGRFYAWLERTGKVLVNPMDGLILPQIKDAIPRSVLTPSEMRRLLNAPDTSTPLGIRDKTMLELFYSTGIRLSELCSLTVYDVDPVAGYVRVNSGKGSKDRVVPMGRKASDYIKDYLRNVRGGFTRKRRDERALFVGQKGRKIHFLIVERLVREYARSVGIRKRVTPHALRHTCATHMIHGGADVVHVQRLLGHASIDTTQIYIRVAGRDVKRTHLQTHPREQDK